MHRKCQLPRIFPNAFHPLPIHNPTDIFYITTNYLTLAYSLILPTFMSHTHSKLPHQFSISLLFIFPQTRVYCADGKRHQIQIPS